MTVDPERVTTLAAAYTAAWNSGSPEAVASFYAPDGRIVINRGEPWVGHKGIADMAAGFYADVPDLKLVCDDIRCAVVASRGWYDADDYERQTTSR